MSIGIMQGRLVPPEGGRFQSFPKSRWRDEFALAASAGIATIEWIWDAYGLGVNPLESDAGVAEMRALMERNGVAVRSLCADYFMDFPLVRVAGAELAEREGSLRWLIARCRHAGIERIVLPFVDVSRIETDGDFAQAVRVVEDALPIAAAAEIELHLETSLPPARFARLLAALPHPSVRVNYDSGNSASLGYRPAEEFGAYGRRVGSVHLKDRMLGAGTVPLGAGDADFVSLAEALRSIQYRGDVVLQVARDAPGCEAAWARSNVDFAIANGLWAPA